MTGDILENYCYSDDLVNVARVLFAVAIMLTYPVECFVTREVSHSTLSTAAVSFYHSHCLKAAAHVQLENAWQSLAYSPLGAVVSPPSEYL